MTEKKATPEIDTVPAISAEGSNPPVDTKDGNTDKGGVSPKVWMGTAVGVGSAALVAALMYAKRRK